MSGNGKPQLSGIAVEPPFAPPKADDEIGLALNREELNFIIGAMSRVGIQGEDSAKKYLALMDKLRSAEAVQMASILPPDPSTNM